MSFCTNWTTVINIDFDPCALCVVTDYTRKKAVKATWDCSECGTAVKFELDIEGSIQF